VLGSLVSSGPRAVRLTREAQRRGAMQKTRELSGLIAFLRDRRLGVVVEIGTLRGGTLWTWCQIAEPDAILVSIDLPEDQHVGAGGNRDTERMRGFARGAQTIEFLRGDSHDERTLAGLRDLLAGREIDFLFIDGDHTYEGVRRDYEMYAPLVSGAGVIGLHDVLPHPGVPTCEVYRFWEELRSANEVEEFVDAHDATSNGAWGGIGVVHVEGRRTSGAAA
jgi:predicted O-methyltransferase YrrM